MFIGVITYNKNVVENVTIEAKTDEDASQILAEYVYKTYNQDAPTGKQYFTGVIINTNGLKQIGKLEVAV